MKKGGVYLRVLGIGSGVCLTAAGIFSIWNPQFAAKFLTVVFGAALLASGLLDIAAYIACRRAALGAGWILLDGILTTLMAVLLLCNSWLVGLAVPVIFSMWILFSGISSVVRSLDLKAFRVRGWGWFLTIGILQMVAGVLLFIQPVATAMAVSLLVGLVLILQGFTAIVSGLFSRRFLS